MYYYYALDLCLIDIIDFTHQYLFLQLLDGDIFRLCNMEFYALKFFFLAANKIINTEE